MKGASRNFVAIGNQLQGSEEARGVVRSWKKLEAIVVEMSVQKQLQTPGP